MRDLTYPPIVAIARTAFKALGITIDMTGAEHVPTTGPALLAFNHISYVDFVFGGLAARPSRRYVRFMAKRELFDHRYVGPLMRSLHHISVDRSAGVGSVRTALQYLAAGEVVGIFPEATISRSFELKEFKSGAVRLAQESGAPLIPVVLWGTQRMKTKDHPKNFGRGHQISIRVGPPLHIERAEDPETATERLSSTMSALLDASISAYPLSAEGAWWAPRRFGGTAPTPAEANELDRAELIRRVKERAAERAEKRAKEQAKAAKEGQSDESKSDSGSGA